jgi:hypothetical protein
MGEDIIDILLDFGAWLLVGLMILFTPLLHFFIGIVIGYCIKITISKVFCNGLLLLGINIYSDQIPLLCGILNLLGSFFRRSSYSIPFIEYEDEE